MAREYDLVVRGGTIYDGQGGEAFEGDVAVRDGRIAAVGDVSGAGAEEIDARGKLVAPGFVDIHTHYDGQATWESRMQPSSWHGVTTVVMGNCGVGFAPCRPGDHDRLIKLMEGVEDIPFPVLAEGLPWNWESYPDYLDQLARRRFDVDIGSQLPHAALRVYVMGQRGVDREPATQEDIAAMAALAREAMEAGAIGFGTSRTLNHRSSDGSPIATLTAGEDELTGIALAIAAAGKGVLQVVSDFADEKAEFAMLRRVVEKSGRPMSFSLVQSPVRRDNYLTLLAQVEDAVSAGLEIKAQAAVRPVGVLFGLELTLNPFLPYPVYKEIAKRPLAERVALLKDPQFRERLLSHPPEGRVRGRLKDWSNMHVVTGMPDYEPTPETSIATIAERTGRAPEDVALDHLVSNDGHAMIYVPVLNYGDGDLEPARYMMNHKDVVPGLSDGGAHVGTICDGSFPTTLLAYWTRDRTRGPRLPLAQVFRMQARDTARAVGLYDRGVLARGYRADLNVIDYDNVRLFAPEVAYDLPAGGRRLLQRASGYTATVVAGEVTYRDGVATDALPGRLLRGAQPAPMAAAAE
ncbi:MAG TPA: amidohydrolase family protein [Caulobacteraceae bacterium]|nr:amidohydrolase family protein [Caulobacteraceae bacterium]